jgi:ubiquinone/menaquinone biosynthesis C-methylase UbiE
MPQPAVHHPAFARVLSLASRHEPAQMRRRRQELLAALSGRVIELGAGAGANFVDYPRTVEQVVVAEPEPYLREQAQAAAATAAVAVEVHVGVADQLPAEIRRSMPRWRAWSSAPCPTKAIALAELRRVVRPGGMLRFYDRIPRTTPQSHAARNSLTACSLAARVRRLPHRPRHPGRDRRGRL